MDFLWTLMIRIFNSGFCYKKHQFCKISGSLTANYFGKVTSVICINRAFKINCMVWVGIFSHKEQAIEAKKTHAFEKQEFARISFSVRDCKRNKLLSEVTKTTQYFEWPYYKSKRKCQPSIMTKKMYSDFSFLMYSYSAVQKINLCGEIDIGQFGLVCLLSTKR